MNPFDRIFTIMTKPWVVISYLVFIIISFFYLDQPIAYYFYACNVKEKLPILYWMTKVGLGPVYIALLFLLALFFRFISHNKIAELRSWFLWLCVLIPNLICLVLKVSIGRSRPELLFEGYQYGFYGFHIQAPYWSFPSGHTTTIMGFVLGLGILFPRYCYSFLLAGFVVISTRVLLTSHYLSDVMATSYLTLLEVWFVYGYVRRKMCFTPISGCITA